MSQSVPVTTADLASAKNAFEQQYGFPAPPQKRYSAAWVESTTLAALHPSPRYEGERFQRIVTKISVLQQWLERHARRSGSSSRLGPPTPMREVLALLQVVDDPEAIARFFLARVPCPTLLDIDTYEQAKALLQRRPELDARRADVLLDYKIFTQIKRGRMTDSGSYSGLAASSTGATRMAQHDAGFKGALQLSSYADLPSQRILYNPRTVPGSPLCFVASNFHLSQAALMEVFAWTTGFLWPLRAGHINRITASLDEMLLCAEFDDWIKVLPGLEDLDEKHQRGREFRPLNTAFPTGLPAKSSTSTAKLLAPVALPNIDLAARRSLLASVLENRGVRVTHRTGRLLVRIGQISHSVLWTSTEPLGPARLRIQWLRRERPSQSGSPMAATATISQLLDNFEVLVQFQDGTVTSVGFSGFKHVEADYSEDGDGINMRGGAAGSSVISHPDEDGWGPLLENLHWAAMAANLMLPVSLAVTQAATPLLAGMAQRLVSRTGCAVGAVCDRQEGAGQQWMVAMPLFRRRRLTNSYAVTQLEEQDVGEWWSLPPDMNPSEEMRAAYASKSIDDDDQWQLFLLLRAEGKKHLLYGWQDASSPASKVKWKKVSAPLCPCHRFYLNLVREFHGLDFQLKPQRGSQARYDKANQIIRTPYRRVQA